MITITEMNPIYSKISSVSVAKELLNIKKEYWKNTGYKKERIEYLKYLVERDGTFLTGFIPKIEREIECELDLIEYGIEVDNPHLKGITFREDQEAQIQSAICKHRGILLAPTGAGKTVLIAGLISCYKDARILFLVHTIDLVDQTIAEFKKFGFTNISKMGGGEKDISGRIVVSSIQTFSNLEIDEYCDKFDAVFVDEAHHISGFPDTKKPDGSMYYKVLSNLLAPVRFGVTATLSSNQEARMCSEGLLGPVISELTFEDAKELDILATPKIKLVKVDPYQNYEVRTYADTYDAAVVNNRARNIQIIEEIIALNEQGLSTVTYVQKISHIENLLDLAEDMDVQLQEVKGATSGEDRKFIKDDLHNKKVMNVVATVVWREGLNIRSLNAIIIAGGGKNEKDLIQAVGRGARKDEGKEEFIIIDFVDSAKYLSQHFCERLGVYINKGWL
jgi:superfamily II DNA or RNA helicase